MTNFTRARSRTRDLQDAIERGVYGEWQEVPGAGAMMSVRGTGTLDEEVPIMNMGYSFRLPPNANAEVIMLALGSDVNDKVALPTIPRAAQHPWGVGEGGVQHPTDPSRRLEFNADETWLTDGRYAIGSAKQLVIEVSGSSVTISVSGDLDIRCGRLTHNGANIGEGHVHGGVTSGTSNTGGPF